MADHEEDKLQDNIRPCTSIPTNGGLLKRIPLVGDYVSLTFDSGERFYLSFGESDIDDLPDKFNKYSCNYESSDLVYKAEELVSLFNFLLSCIYLYKYVSAEEFQV